MQNLIPGQVWTDDEDCLMITEVINDDFITVKGIAVLNGVVNVNYTTRLRDGTYLEFPKLIFEPKTYA
jgi:hypothetical protein